MTTTTFAAPAPDEECRAPGPATTPTPGRAMLAGILLVDDDETTNYLNERLLRRLRVTDHIFVAADGEAALTILAQLCASPAGACPVLVLLDLNMPRMNGIEFLEAYQAQPPAPPLTIVALTSSVNTRDLTQLRQFAGMEILEKPLTEEKVNGLLRRYFPGVQAAHV